MATFWSSRPRWQSRDANVRRDAVSNDTQPELLAQLPALAREDADASVRIAAMRRVADLALTQSCAESDADSAVREAANALYLALLDGSHRAAPALVERMQWLAAIDDRALREHLARNAREADLREAALDGNVRPGLLNECILADPDPALRLRLLARVTDADTLQRIATQSRRRDKQVAQVASARVMALRVAAGDAAAIQSCAEQCCQQLEQATALDRGGRDQALALAESLWQSLGNAPADALATRYMHASTQLKAINTAADAPADAFVTAPVEPSPPRDAEPDHASAPVSNTPLDAQRLIAQARFQADVAEGTQYAPVRPKPKPALVDVGKLLDALEAALDQGDLATTRRVDLSIEQLPNSPSTGKLAARWQRARGRSHELQRWQQWSTRRQRRQLCVDADQLRESGLHPDALSTRVRELRGAWQTLDALQADAPGGADLALKKRFNSLCQQALAAAKPYFKARDALRSQHSDAVRALLDECSAAMAADKPHDWHALEALRKRLPASLRELDSVEPAARKSLANTLHRQLRQLDTLLGEHHAHIQAAHEKLIAQAQALGASGHASAIAGVRDLQAQWKALGPGRRDHDHRQWRSFRSACDAIFSQRDQERKAASAREQADQDRANQLIQQLQQTTANTSDALQRLRRDSEAAWRDLSIRERHLSQAWRDAQAEIDRRIATLKRAETRTQYMQALESSEGAAKHAVLASAWRQRSPAPADENAARDVLVRCEALAGIDSPDEDQERRVRLRLQRLQAALGQGQRRDPEHELEAILADWIRLGPLPSAAVTFQARMQRALAAALDQH